MLPHVVGVGDVPGHAIGRAAQLLLDEEPLGDAPAVPTVLWRMRTTVYAVFHRLRADELLGLGRQRSARQLGGDLERDEHLIDEGRRACLEVSEVVGASGGIGAHVSPGGCQDGDAHQAI